MSQESTAEDSVPYYLMPVAAIFGTYTLLATVNVLYTIYKVATYSKSSEAVASRDPPSVKSRRFVFTVLSIIVSTLAYGYITATINNSISSLDVFDPFEILNIESSANITSIKSAYRNLSKLNHPDKPGGSAEQFQRINLAYKALSDPASKENYQLYGHPDGPQTSTLSFAMPDWLLHPKGNVAIILVIMYMALFASIILYVVRYVSKTEEDVRKKQWDNSVAESDVSYLAMNLSPESTHLEVLFTIATAPESLDITTAAIEQTEDLKRQRLEFLKPELKKSVKKVDENKFDLDDGGWAEDDDGDDAKAEAASRQEKEKLAKEVAAASGKSELIKHLKIEGVDDNVLGQKWVEEALTKIGQWPPTAENWNGLQKTYSLSTKGKKTEVLEGLDHPSVRRNLCMSLGRLNANFLNTHPELLLAQKEQRIDATYFRGTMEYRQRTGLLLEAALRVAGSTKCYRLYKTIVECASMFKIGVKSSSDPKAITMFREIMGKVYGGSTGVPRLIVSDIDIETPGEEEIATGDTCKLELEVNRVHAENFTKQKVEMATKQGIPPQVALQAYREGWWILVRAERLDGSIENNDEHWSKNPILSKLDQSTKKKFESEAEEHRLLNAWPFIVSNIQQKTGKVKVRFTAPSVPGKYKFYVDVKSQDFLGCDQTFSLEKDILDKEELERKEAEDGGEEEEEEEEEEPKKTK